jgi:hypothetical protein
MMPITLPCDRALLADAAATGRLGVGVEPFGPDAPIAWLSVAPDFPRLLVDAERP